MKFYFRLLYHKLETILVYQATTLSAYLTKLIYIIMLRKKFKCRK